MHKVQPKKKGVKP